MCKHVLNAQVAIRAPCCQKWFDCPECHAEKSDHQLRKTFEMAFLCKKCKKAFRKDAREMEDADEFCPHCDNQFAQNVLELPGKLVELETCPSVGWPNRLASTLEAKEPKAMLGVEGEDARVDNRMLKDDRTKERSGRSLFDRDTTDKVDQFDYSRR